jgi:hypothetical protein
MSLLGKLILTFMRAASLLAAGFVLLVIGIEVAKRWLGGGLDSMRTPDIAFMGVLVAMLVGFLWLARSITRELRKH